MEYLRRTHSEVLGNTKIFHNTSEEYHFVESCLNKIKSRPNGSYLLEMCDKYTALDKEIHIKVMHSGQCSTEPNFNDRFRETHNLPDDKTDPLYQSMIKVRYKPMPPSRRGIGVGSEIRFNMEESRVVDEEGIGERIQNQGLAFISLAHELVHAYHFAHGTHIPEEPHRPLIDHEEDRAIGIMDYKGLGPNENSVRSDYNLPQRSTRFDRNEFAPLAAQYLPNE